MNTVTVHRNLNLKCWSVKVGKEKVKHVDEILLQHCSFKVWKGGRKRVMETGRKAVHAFVVGSVEEEKGVEKPPGAVRVSYNPFKKDFFYEADTGEKVEVCETAAFLKDGTLWVK